MPYLPILPYEIAISLGRTAITILLPSSGGIGIRLNIPRPMFTITPADNISIKIEKKDEHIQGRGFPQKQRVSL